MIAVALRVIPLTDESLSVTGYGCMAQQGDRVRGRTAEAVIRRIDEGVSDRLLRQERVGESAVEPRLAELDREWDVDRVITVEAAATALTGLALGRLVDSRLFAVPAVVAGALIAYAARGWYPLLPVIRAAGVRTAREIQRERFALKALRGDFSFADAPVREIAR